MTRRTPLRWTLSALADIGLLVLLAQPASAHKAHEQQASVEASHVEEAAPTAPPSPETFIAQDPPEASGGVSEGAKPTPALTLIAWLGRFHPIVVHFPIALLTAALVAELLFAITAQELFRHALRFTLFGGVLAATVAAPLGWGFAATSQSDTGWLLEAHRWAGTAASILGVITLWVTERTERNQGARAALRSLLLLTALLIGATGFLGASLVYGIDHLRWP